MVHQGLFNRVVYVGVSCNVGRRINEHYEGYLRGNRTIYNAGHNDDVYRLMSTYKIRNHIKYYQSLARDYEIWGSTTLHFDTPKNILAKNQTFDATWESIAFEKYIPQLVVWALPMANYCYSNATKIESVIQSKLIKSFDLSGFFNAKYVSILGKIEKPYLKKVKCLIIDVPDVDSASKIIFSNLYSKKIDENFCREFHSQFESEISQREKGIQRRQEIRNHKISLHENYGKPWTLKEMEKLRVMLVDFDMSPTEISDYLGRGPRSISKKIIENDKITNHKWRESVGWL
ncbi:GIY-YIG nuclease family protein [Salmonella enterica]|nr:GIY-YIG nuclease family protein [Salmonella enterica]ECD4975401.1 GIY-YIG nuclease family protein [Salmonella enterica subsp. enterica serovar Oranienburg]EAO5275447.1 GIY-YIG nuclease family protein [Salmonella enterica]EAS1265741.1 GIY-YIG nuclease family protein [Salmonella enterica]EAU2201373.1 GIY-YIG nuclease family protein [Salmonella enterica]